MIRLCAAGLGLSLAFSAAVPAQIVEIIDGTGDDQGNVLTRPEGIAIDGPGNIFVAGNQSHNVFKIEPSGDITEIIDEQGDGQGNQLLHPHGVAVDPAGNVYVAGGSSHNAFKIAPSGDIAEIIDGNGDGQGNPLNAPRAIAVDLEGNVYLAGLSSDNVFRITSPGEPSQTIEEVMDETGDGSPLDGPSAMAVDQHGTLYVVGLGSHNAFMLTPTGQPTEIITQAGDDEGNTLDFPRGVAADYSGNVFVSGSASDNVFKIESAGGPGQSVVEILDEGELFAPEQMSVDHSGSLYLVARGASGGDVFRIGEPGQIGQTVEEIIGANGDGKGNHLLAPTGVAVSDDGDVFVTGANSDNAFRITGAAAPSMQYVALGDSYSAGEGAGDYTELTNIHNVNECHRSEIAWTSDSPGRDETLRLPGPLLNFTRRSVACSGAVLSDLTQQSHKGWTGEGPQLDRLGDPEVISVTIGGNDALFPEVLTLCLGYQDCHIWEDWGDGVGALGDLVLDLVQDLKGGELTAAYQAIKDRAPGAAVFVAGYPDLVPADIDELTPSCVVLGARLEPNETSWMRAVGGALNQALECSAREAGVHFVPIDFTGHEACKAGELDWINALRPAPFPVLPESFHPNWRGQREYARQIGRFVAEDPSRITENPDEEPGACGTTLSKLGAPRPSLGDVEVVGEFPAGCGETMGAYVPAQEISLLGAGFASGAALSLEVLYEDGTTESLGNAIADSSGFFEHTTTIPGSSPTSGSALVLVRGEGVGTERRLLLATIMLAASLTEDSDGDSVPDNCDNCPEDVNQPQADADGDGLGDACDACPLDSQNDLDDDGVCDNVDGCVDLERLDLTDEIISTGRTESACSVVTATNYEITSSGNVTIISGAVIEIGDGFVVDDGGHLVAAIGTP